MNTKAVDLVRRIRDRRYEQLKGKTQDERLAFYRAKAQALREKAMVQLSVEAAGKGAPQS